MLNHAVVPATAATSHWCMVLHGLGDSMQGWMPVASDLAIDHLGYIFVDAPDPYHGGYSWFPVPGLSDDVSTPEDMHAGIARSRGLLCELIAAVCQRLGISCQRLFLLGFSQGCLMTMDTGLRHDQRFAGLVGISGWLSLQAGIDAALGPAARKQDVLWTHGNEDQLLPLSNTQRVVERLQQAGVDIDWRVYPKEHTLDPHAELPDLRRWLAERVAG
ncbi:MAG: alpha/beta hydrolase [Planctomycetota bacterium]